MKKKDLLALVLLGAVLAVVASLLIGKVGRGGQPRTAEVEVVAPLDPTFNEDARNILLGRSNTEESKSFAAPLNLKQGFGNTNPFQTR
ncbi:hypothetical protein HY346_01040 [Candidatus Microgenomates bacterium]|nr:hypothetical protein [Candidatus Microgenomates bacterium]